MNELIQPRMSKEEFGVRAMEMAERNTDWFDVLFRNAVTHSHNVSVQGGTKRRSIMCRWGIITTRVARKGR